MLIIFNKSGNEFQIDYQNDSFSQGDNAVHTIDVIVDDLTFSNYSHNGYVQFLRNGEKEPSPKFAMATKKHLYNGKYYNGYSYKMQSEWYTAVAGNLKMTIEIKNYNDDGLESNKAYGIVNIPVQPSVSPISEVESKITDEEYVSLINLINSKFNKDDYDIEKSWYDNEEDFANECIDTIIQEPTIRKIFFTSIGDLPTRYEAIGLVEQKDYIYYCNIISTKGLSRYYKYNSNEYVHKLPFETDELIIKKDQQDGETSITHKGLNVYQESDEINRASLYAEKNRVGLYIQKGYDDATYTHEKIIVGKSGKYKELILPFKEGTIATIEDVEELDSEVVHLSGEETIHDKKYFTSPIYLENIEMPYVVSAVSGKVGMRAYTENGASGKIAGQFAISNSYWDEYEGHFANVQAYDKNGTPHSLIVSKKGAEIDGKKLATEDYVFSKVSEIVAGAPSDFDTLKEIANWIKEDESGTANLLADVEKKAYRTELFSKQYDDLLNAPEKLNIVVRDTISADTYNEAREIQIGKDKFKFGSGSKIKANEFVDGTLPTLEYLNIDGKTFKVPNLVTDGSLKFITKINFDEELGRFPLIVDNLESQKMYLLMSENGRGMKSATFMYFMQYGSPFYSPSVWWDIDDLEYPAYIVTDFKGIIFENDNGASFDFNADSNIEIYELPFGESAQVEKHNKTINALMQRVSDLEQKAGLTSVGYVQDSTLNLIRVNVVDDVLEVSGFKFDGEVMII